MNKRVIYASVLSVLIAMGVSVLLDILFPPTHKETQAFLSDTPEVEMPLAPSASGEIISLLQGEELSLPFETTRLEGLFSLRNASLVSLSFKTYKSDKGQRIELVDSTFSSQGLYLEEIKVYDSLLPQDLLYRLISSSEDTYVFQTDFLFNREPVTLLKTYRFDQDRYLFRVQWQVKGVPVQALSSRVSFVENLPPYGASDPTTAYMYTTKLTKVSKGGTGQGHWAGASNRYLAMAVIPDRTGDMNWTLEEGKPSIVSWSPTFVSVPNGANESFFSLYLGPKEKEELVSYNSKETNAFALSDLRLETLAQKGWLSWVQNLLAWVLGFFYQVIPNWGVAIILLTVSVKILLYPLALQAHVSTSAMQKIQPEMKLLQEKYKEDPVKVQQEMQKIYQKYGVNPLGGCLPVLVQIPIFLALYGLLNNYLVLRGAVFIPGWIYDLSLSESIYSLPFSLPFLGWQDVRLLPFIMLLTQFFSGWISMKNAQAMAVNSQQQKFLFYGMPSIFFFVLYNMASGLLIYWIVNNILTVAQQLYLTRYHK